MSYFMIFCNKTTQPTSHCETVNCKHANLKTASQKKTRKKKPFSPRHETPFPKRRPKFVYVLQIWCKGLFARNTNCLINLGPLHMKLKDKS